MDRARNSDIVRSRTEPWDIVVIGGGATGAGCALDAASRGFDVLLLEQHDFGKGTSSRSTKLVHGGVRYLAQGNISLVRESLHERGLLLRNAQHVVRTLPLVVPCYSVWQKIFYGTGLKVYDLLAGKYSLGRSTILSRRETLRRMPNLLEDGLRGGILYWDAQFDDTRLLIDILRTAETHGATVLNYARVASLQKNAGGRIDGVVVELDGDEIELTSRAVINATGPFCDPVRKLSDPAAKPVVRFSQGIHLVFDRRFIGSDTALMIPKTSDGRLLFCIPWNEHLLVGTTDTPIDSPEIEPKALETEIDFVLETAGSYLAQKPARADILSVFAGIRPLVNQREIDKTSSISRGHDLFVDDSGLITITGGKWTTYRKMGEDAVNTAIKAAELERRECTTYDLPIEASKSVAGERLHPDLPYTRDDVIRAVREEMAVTLEDVLARRTRALFLNAKAALEVAPVVAQVMSEEMETDGEWAASQVKEFRLVAEAYTGKG